LGMAAWAGDIISDQHFPFPTVSSTAFR